VKILPIKIVPIELKKRNSLLLAAFATPASASVVPLLWFL
jgi:hypothetical protein